MPTSRTTTSRSEPYRSGSEGVFGEALKAQVAGRGIEVGFETEAVPYVLECRYIPDFVLKFLNGRKLYVEFKGYLLDEDRRKMAAVRKQHPEIDLRLVFENLRGANLPTRKGAKSTMADWCRKVGIPWAVAAVPTEWLE